MSERKKDNVYEREKRRERKREREKERERESESRCVMSSMGNGFLAIFLCPFSWQRQFNFSRHIMKQIILSKIEQK